MHLLLNGKVLTQRHSLDEPYKTELLQVAKPGMFIGCPELDRGISVAPTTFSMVVTHQAHLLKVPNSTYEQLWRDQNCQDKQVVLSSLESFELFR